MLRASRHGFLARADRSRGFVRAVRRGSLARGDHSRGFVRAVRRTTCSENALADTRVRPPHLPSHARARPQLARQDTYSAATANLATRYKIMHTRDASDVDIDRAQSNVSTDSVVSL